MAMSKKDYVLITDAFAHHMFAKMDWSTFLFTAFYAAMALHMLFIR